MTNHCSTTMRALWCTAAVGFHASFVAQAVNDVIPEPDCDESMSVSVRYSSTSARLYVEADTPGERGGCMTLSHIFSHRDGKEPLYAVDPDTGERTPNATGTWLLTESLYVEDGVTLKVHGGRDGDADELRLLSNASTIINLRAHGGSLSFHDTKVFSWDEAANTYDRNYRDGRSYISAVSEIITDENETCIGSAQKTMGEARMDVIRSEMGYLGYYESESYGLTWKVRGFCKDKGNPEVFDDVNVYGNIYDSNIHHNYFGVYTYGHQQGDWRRNEMHNNIEYGFDPHDDSDYLNIHDNVVYSNGNHGIIASKRCNGVSIQDNIVYNGRNAGLFLHRSSDDAIVKGNIVYNNADAGLAMLESFNAEVSDNMFEDNLYGVRMSVGCAYNIISNNLIKNSEKYNAYTYLGTDSPDVVDSGRSMSNTFIGNTIIGGRETIKLKEADNMIFLENTFEDATAIRFYDTTNTLMLDNTGLDALDLELKTNSSCFDELSDSLFVPVC